LERTVGYDVTFSVPKSVSLVYAMSSDKRIMNALRGAVNETMASSLLMSPASSVRGTCAVSLTWPR
jgi:conjugative relaxase-like TrwC/TraI family protein